VPPCIVTHRWCAQANKYKAGMFSLAQCFVECDMSEYDYNDFDVFVLCGLMFWNVSVASSAHRDMRRDRPVHCCWVCVSINDADLRLMRAACLLWTSLWTCCRRGLGGILCLCCLSISARVTAR
jgi:hypothetical protein